MRTIRLREDECLTGAETEALAGTLLGEDSYRYLVREDCDTFKPDSTRLLAFRRACLPAELCRVGYESLRGAATPTDNRGVATGIIDKAELAELPYRVGSGLSRVKYCPVTKGGSLSNQNRAKSAIRSGVAGFFDRSPRFPYCRQTAFTIAEGDRFAAALPFIRAVNAVFARAVPDRHAAQLARVRETHPDFVIPGTAFTTVTVNRNWQTAVHQDRGDLKAGFGVMGVLQAGRYAGGHLVFPRYRTAVDMRTGDVLLADVHEFHGNTPLVGIPGGFERISLVFYYREFMADCGSAAEELARAKRRRPGTPLRGRPG